MNSRSKYVSQSWCPGCSSSGSSVHKPSPSLDRCHAEEPLGHLPGGPRHFSLNRTQKASLAVLNSVSPRRKSRSSMATLGGQGLGNRCIPASVRAQIRASRQCLHSEYHAYRGRQPGATREEAGGRYLPPAAGMGRNRRAHAEESFPAFSRGRGMSRLVLVPSPPPIFISIENTDAQVIVPCFAASLVPADGAD